ncbi:MAG: polynucleotide adenylyltransferase PcnB [Deltaproteobacteria bacterium]|nr:polynucleotide adenylyltransferase PcnB [Candidatus Zymogenaceae bacterium]
MGWLKNTISEIFSSLGTPKSEGPRRPSPPHTPETVILPRDKHPISRRNIDPDALKVLYRLLNHGYKAYLVGGSVRDLLLSRKPKDFDVATDASPKDIRRLFANSVIIGRRFKIVHIRFRNNKIIEVTTFRKKGEEDESRPGLPTMRDNTFGTPKEDAFRRDLTINGLFYSVKDYTIIDYVGGLEDLENKIIRMIGDPRTRITEDPVRIIRAIRHAARIGFTIDPEIRQAVGELRHNLTHCSPARFHEELVKELKGGYSRETLRLFKEYGILEVLFPEMHKAVDEKAVIAESFYSCLGLLDAMTRSGREFSIPFLFSVPMIPVVTALIRTQVRESESKPDIPRLIGVFLTQALSRVGVSKRTIDSMRHLLFLNWKMLEMFEHGHISSSLRHKAYFSEAFDLLAIATKASGAFPGAPWPPGPDGFEPLKRFIHAPRKKRRRGPRGKRDNIAAAD